MAFDVKGYLTKLAKDNGVADDKLTAALEVIGNEKIAKDFENGFLRQEDYSRNMDAVKKREKDLNDWYQQQVQTATNNQKIVTETEGKLSKYRELYGELDDSSMAKIVNNPDVLTKKEFEEGLQRVGQQSIQVTKMAMKCSADYMKRFGEVLDPDQLEKFALESGLPLNAAYDKFIEPRVNELTNKSWEERLAKAKAEGAEEERSKRAIPTDAKAKDASAFMTNMRRSEKPALTPSQSFVEAWTGAQK